MSQRNRDVRLREEQEYQEPEEHDGFLLSDEEFEGLASDLTRIIEEIDRIRDCNLPKSSAHANYLHASLRTDIGLDYDNREKLQGVVRTYSARARGVIEEACLDLSELFGPVVGTGARKNPLGQRGGYI